MSLAHTLVGQKIQLLEFTEPGTIVSSHVYSKREIELAIAIRGSIFIVKRSYNFIKRNIAKV